MLSICMATYNGEKYIYNQMRSILAQISEFDEIIVQDDCSSDQTLRYIYEIDDKRIKIAVNSENVGVIATFEAAIRRAEGQIIFLSDQDDTWLPGKLDAVVAQFKRPDVMAVVTDARITDDDGNIISESYQQLIGGGPGVLKNFWRNSYLGCCLAFRKEVTTVALPIPRKVRTHDGWIGIVSNMIGEVSFIECSYLNYRRHGNNVSQMNRFPLTDVLARRVVLIYHMLRVQSAIIGIRRTLQKTNNSRRL